MIEYLQKQEYSETTEYTDRRHSSDKTGRTVSHNPADWMPAVAAAGGNVSLTGITETHKTEISEYEGFTKTADFVLSKGINAGLQFAGIPPGASEGLTTSIIIVGEGAVRGDSDPLMRLTHPDNLKEIGTDAVVGYVLGYLKEVGSDYIGNKFWGYYFPRSGQTDDPNRQTIYTSHTK